MPEPRGQKLWAILLLVDFFFVLIFAGAFAGKLYTHLLAPSVPTAPKRQRRAKPPEPEPAKEAAKTSEPAAKETAKSEPSKPAPKPAPVAKAVPGKVVDIPPTSGDAPRPPKPSLLYDSPQRQQAQLHGQSGTATASAAAAVSQTGTAATAAPAPAGAPGVVKAVPVRFQLKAPSAKTVELAGAFIVRGGKKSMSSQPDGQWTITVYLTPNTYRYWFLVNGKKTLDPENANTERGASVISVAP